MTRFLTTLRTLTARAALWQVRWRRHLPPLRVGGAYYGSIQAVPTWTRRQPIGGVVVNLAPFHPAMSKTFDSFFKVLFIFRLHYLCAIGLGAIFSLRRRPPAGLCSNLKLHDSWKTTSVSEMARRTHGTFALCGESFLISFIRLPFPA